MRFPDSAFPSAAAWSRPCSPAARRSAAYSGATEPCTRAALQDARSRPYQIEYFDAKGRIFLRLNLDYAENFDHQTAGSGGSGGSGCSSTANNPAAVSWGFSPIGWQWNRNSFPASDTDLDSTLQALRNAHITWETNDNPCGIADNSSLNFTYQGTTNEGASFADGLSVIDYGEVSNISGSSTAIATEATRFSALTGEAIESDIRFDNDVPWTNSPGTQSGQYDVESVAAHEVGHTALFGHVTGAGQTMRQGVDPGTTWKRNLGEGDARGNNSKY